jgi:DNA-binding LytR/AlgR family response regulator
MKIKCLLADDEPPARELLASYINRLDDLELCGQCADSLETFKFLQKNEVNLLFLDIQMPGMNGLELIKSLHNPPHIVLITAYREYAVEAFELDVMDYLLKPISMQRLLQATQKVTERLTARLTGVDTMRQSAVDYFFVRHENKLVRINFADILFVEGMQNFVKIHTPAKTYVITNTMKAMDELLPPGDFMRVHNSYTVALAAIHAVYGNSIKIGQVQIPIGSNFKAAFMSRIA